jgi:hypothetical protein
MRFAFRERRQRLLDMKGKKERTLEDWRQTDIGWKGFFQGYVTAQSDAFHGANDRVEYIVTNLRSMARNGKTAEEMLEFLNGIKT